MDFSENTYQRSYYTGLESEVCLYCHDSEEKRHYQVDNLLFVNMQQGSKSILIPNQTAIQLGSGEIMVSSSKVSAEIICVGANSTTPNICYSLEVSKKKVRKVLDKINEQHSLPELVSEELLLDKAAIYCKKSVDSVMNSLKNIQQLHFQDIKYKDYWLDLKIDELILVSLQTKMRKLLMDCCTENLTNHRLSFAINYIRQNLCTKINIETLADKACMSKATFFRHFKNSFGLSPIQFIRQERINAAKELLKKSAFSISKIAYQLGYSSPSYFILQFKSLEKISPQQYRQILHLKQETNKQQDIT